VTTAASRRSPIGKYKDALVAGPPSPRLAPPPANLEIMPVV
jgi:hypothetical protein